MPRLIGLLVLSAAVGVLRAEAPAGDPVLDPAAAFVLKNFQGDAQRGSVEAIDTPHGAGFRVTSGAASAFWHVALTTGDFQPLRRGDVLLLTFHARTLRTAHESGAGQVTAFVQHNERPFDPSLMQEVSVGAQWTRVDLPFEVIRSYPPELDQLTFGVGAAEQVVEIAGVQLHRYPAGVAVRDLPMFRVTYAGREPDAPWRAAAQDRIARLRQSDLRLKVVDAAGQPVPGAKVEVRMRRHAFTFGAAIDAGLWTRDTTEAARYRGHVRELFNAATIENHLKWSRWEDPPQRAAALRVLHELRDAGLRARGHTLLWPSFAKSRVDLSAVKDDPAALAARIDGHVRDITDATAGLIAEWDVVNEPWNNHDFLDILGRDAMAHWFRLARTQAPSARLFINDFGILVSPRPETDEHVAHYDQTIAYLLEQGAPVDAIGLQGHFGGPVPIATLQRTLDRFGRFGLGLAVTEYDLFTGDEVLAADFLRDLLTLVFSHERAVGFTMWGFWDGNHWRGNAPLFRKDWSAKPALEAYRDLVFRQWWTAADATTDAAGTATVRAFHGDHRVTVTAPAGAIATEVNVAGPADVTVVLP